MADLNDVRAVAMRLLATREHCTFELNRKLSQKGFEAHDIARIIEECRQNRFLSDERFTEAFVNSRRERGNGPSRIKRELQQLQIDAHLIATYLDFRDPTWIERARQVREKKFGDDIPNNYQSKMRQARFLEYRGFGHDQIQHVLREDDLVCG